MLVPPTAITLLQAEKHVQSRLSNWKSGDPLQKLAQALRPGDSVSTSPVKLLHDKSIMHNSKLTGGTGAGVGGEVGGDVGGDVGEDVGVRVEDELGGVVGCMKFRA